MKKVILILLITLFFVTFSVNIYANEDELPDELDEFLDELPDEVKDILPEEIFDNNADSIKKAAEKMLSWEYVFNVLVDTVGINLEEIGRAFAMICFVLVFSALLRALSKSMKNAALEHILELFSSMLLVSAIIKLVVEPLNKSEMLLNNIRLFVNTASPLLCGMYAMGGNVSSALVNNYGFIVFLTLFENICILSLDMVLGVCLGLILASSFIGDGNLLNLCSAIKKIFTFSVGLMMLIFTTVVSTQNMLATKADSLSSKAAKLLASQMIPVVGGTVGESLRIAGASIEFLRSSIGIVLIVILILIVLPTIVSIFLYRTVFIVSNSVACLLGCNGEGRVLVEISDVLGYALAILAISALTFLFLLTVFAKCTSPLR